VKLKNSESILLPPPKYFVASTILVHMHIENHVTIFEGSIFLKN